MKDIYLLVDSEDGGVYCAATDFERCNLEMARFSAEDQKTLSVINMDLLEDGD